MTTSWPDPGRMVVYGVAGSVVIYLYTRYWHPAPKGLRLPPGPGLLGFPSKRWYENFSGWQKKYGDIIYVNLMGTPFIILNNLGDVEELVNKRANIYSGRPVHVMVTLMDLSWSVVRRQPGKDFNEQRKVFRRAIGPQTISQYDTLMECEAEHLVSSLSGYAGSVDGKLEAAVSAVILKIAYGEKIYKEHGRDLAEVNVENIRLTTSTFTTFYAVGAFPWLRHIPAWFPGAGFHEVARRSKELTQRVKDWAWGMVQEDVAAGVADFSLASQYVNSSEYSNSNLKEAVAVLYGAGVDTTASACQIVLWTMATHSEIQHKVQQELDENIGRDHSATPGQCQKLEYLQAVWRESLRLYPPAPLGLPHVNSQADSWKGYYIPKDTTVNCNIGFMLRDPRIWGPDADTFRPERFIGEGSKNLPDVASIPFGFGKRICPGRYLADRLGSVYIASILSIYEVTAVDGEEIPDPMPFVDGTIRRPSAFRCQFKPRR